MIRMIAVPVLALSWRIKSRIWAWTVTSRAVVGSSAIRSFGSHGERHRDHHALAHAAGKLVRILLHTLRRLGDPHQAQHFDGTLRAPPRRLMPRCSVKVSLIWRPIVSTGFSDVIGSWKIIDISLPPDGAHLALGQLEQILAQNRMRPATMRPGGEAIRRNTESEVTLLPHPDLPTTASVSPGTTENDTPSTARTIPSRVKKWVFRSSTSSSGAGAAIILHVTRKARVECVAHSVAQKIDRQDRQRQERCRERRLGSWRVGTRRGLRP